MTIISKQNIGNLVLCDLCNDEWKPDMQGQGGLMFGTKACCPNCAPRIEKSAKEYNEEAYIRARQPSDMSFHKWVVDVLRGGEPGMIVISTINKGEYDATQKE